MMGAIPVKDKNSEFGGRLNPAKNFRGNCNVFCGLRVPCSDARRLLLGSCVTPILHTARIRSVESFVLINGIRKVVNCELGDAIPN